MVKSKPTDPGDLKFKAKKNKHYLLPKERFKNYTKPANAKTIAHLLSF